jgi:hypothetical protein
VVIENHHTAIIDRVTFDIVQKLRENRRRQTAVGECTPLSGLLRCADCDRKLAIANNCAKYQYYVCSLYRNSNKHYRNDCSRPGIRREVAEEIALAKIREAVEFALADKVKFAEKVRKLSDRDTDKTIKKKAAELAKADRRIAELDRIIKRVYEDHIADKLSDERFEKMLADYETEQSELVAGSAEVRAEVEELRNKMADAKSFIELAERYREIPELTAEVARTFIERIVVHEAVLAPNTRYNGNQPRTQEIHVFLNCIGEFES